MQQIALVLLIGIFGIALRVAIAQFTGTRVTWPLPRSLAQSRLGVLLDRLVSPSPRRKSRSRKRRRARAAEDAYVDHDAGPFEPRLSPFGGGPGAAGDLAVESEYQDGAAAGEPALLPSSRLDFFAQDEQARPVAPRRASAAPLDADSPQTLIVDEDPPAEMLLGQQEEEEDEDFDTVELPTDPDDILSFFEKPAALSQFPDALQEALEPVSIADLLAEARQIRALIEGGQTSP